ncbi:hypothetical protein D3868_11175 [Azospirillum brasilense]|uniref:Uncharacterized protein n=1 Tax=Azospirillum brasilense TaxID=192 RepID=A0A4D8QFL8_AZOBR|nr:hypothetical protein [Azospirillum brasilense]QCO09548.1 hypothetical protein D3868_11175 [Azospirillum brasilense]
MPDSRRFSPSRAVIDPLTPGELTPWVTAPGVSTWMRVAVEKAASAPSTDCGAMAKVTGPAGIDCAIAAGTPDSGRPGTISIVVARSRHRNVLGSRPVNTQPNRPPWTLSRRPFVTPVASHFTDVIARLCRPVRERAAFCDCVSFSPFPDMTTGARRTLGSFFQVPTIFFSGAG